MTEATSYHLCCIGHITTDRVITHGSDTTMPGGTAYYFSHAVACLPLRYKLVTAMHRTDVAAIESLQRRGIEVERLPSAHTVFFENAYGYDPNERRQRVLQQADPFTQQGLQGTEAGIFHLGPLLAGDIDVATIRMLAGRGRVSLDVQGFLRRVTATGDVVPAAWAAKKEALPFVHFLKASEEEAALLTDCTNWREAAKIIAGWGVKEVIITMGSKGSLVYCDSRFYPIPAYAPATVVDATGCGDTYMAGYLGKRISGASVEKAGEFAAAMATKKIEGSGPFTGRAEEVEAVLKQLS